MTECKLPPAGWRCMRGYHPDGPCAALPDVEEMVLTREGEIANTALRKITEYANNLGEPIHPFVQHEIAKALLWAHAGEEAMWEPAPKRPEQPGVLTDKISER